MFKSLRDSLVDMFVTSDNKNFLGTSSIDVIWRAAVSVLITSNVYETRHFLLVRDL